MSSSDRNNETKKEKGRSERLAGALRENLRRRKAQERARGDARAVGTTEKQEDGLDEDPAR